MVREEYPEYHFLSPSTVGGTAVNLLVYVEDVRAFTDRAVAQGATVVRPVSEQFHGDLQSELTDPFGHSWFFSTRMREMSPEELRRQAAAARL
jgi:PhnB protein